MSKRKVKKGLDNDFTPIITEETNLEAKCTIEELGTDKYRLDIDHDPTNGIIYLNVGYDELHDIDSPIYITSDDAYKLATKLLEYANISSQNQSKGEETQKFIEEFETRLNNKEIKWLNIYPVRLANQDYFNGSMILDVKYFLEKTINDKKIPIKFTARIISCNFLKEKDKCFTTELENQLKEKYDIERITLHTERFNDLISSIKSK